MKSIKIFLILILFCHTIAAQSTITTDQILQISTCAGGIVAVPYSTTGNFPFGTTFVAELSNAFGQFNNPVEIGQIPFNLGIIPAVIPSNTNFGFLYKIRVRTMDSSVIGSPCPNTLIITQIALLNQITIEPNQAVCRGESVTLTVLTPVASYLWSTGETTQSISVIDSGIYSVTTTDFLTCKSSTSAHVVYDNCEIGNGDNCNTLSLYPNPSVELINVNNIRANIINYYKIYNNIGTLVKENVLEAGQIDISNLGAGMHFLRVTNTKGFHCGKFLKL